MVGDHREGANKTYQTKTGKVLTDADVEASADEVEGDYEIDALKNTPPRPTVDWIGARRDRSRATRLQLKEAVESRP